MRGTQKEKEKKGNSCRQCVHITWNRCFPPSKHNMCVPFWHSEVVNKRTFNAEGLSSCAEGKGDSSRQQEKCGCEGEQEWARERKSPLGYSVPVQGCYPHLPFTSSFGPPDPQGPTRLEQRQHLQHKCPNPNAQMHTYIFLSLHLSFLSNSSSPYNSLSAHPQGKAWIWRRQPKKHMQTHFFRRCCPRNVARVVSSAPFIYLCMDIWILTLLFAVTFAAFCYYCLCIVNTTPAVSGYWNRALSCFILFGISRGVIGVLKVIIFL